MRYHLDIFRVNIHVAIHFGILYWLWCLVFGWQSTQTLKVSGERCFWGAHIFPSPFRFTIKIQIKYSAIQIESIYNIKIYFAFTYDPNRLTTGNKKTNQHSAFAVAIQKVCTLFTTDNMHKIINVKCKMSSSRETQCEHQRHICFGGCHREIGFSIFLFFQFIWSLFSPHKN